MGRKCRDFDEIAKFLPFYFAEKKLILASKQNNGCGRLIKCLEQKQTGANSKSKSKLICFEEITWETLFRPEKVGYKSWA